MLVPERQLRKEGKALVMRERAFDVLLALIEQPGQVVTKRELCRRAWPERDVDENNLQVEILGLRKLLGKKAIVTAPGRGYQFALQVRKDAPAVVPEGDAMLVGRDDDLGALEALLASGILVTLVGEGGIGKTTLARALARRREARSPGSTCVAALDTVRNADQLRVALADALQLPPAASRCDAAFLGSALRERVLLLVLDGCEQAVQAIAEMASMILNACPGISLLVTSREVLRVPGERVYRLGSLSLEAGGDHGQTQECDAVRLFRHFQSTVVADTPSAEAGDALVFDICRQLEGNPLAIRLFAQRAADTGIEELHPRLAGRLDLLADGGAGTPFRHQSLRASLDWSYQLLSPVEQRVFGELATVEQPFTLTEWLALRGRSTPDAWDAVEALTRLADKSLVSIDRADPPWYRLSETTLLYARTLRVAEHPKTPSVRGRRTT